MILKELVAEIKFQFRYILPGHIFKDITVMMSKSDINIFSSYLSSCKGTYVEFGAGGSTLMSLKYVKDFYSVENDRVFINYLVRKYSIPKNRFIYANTGIIGPFGRPISILRNSFLVTNYERYWLSFFEKNIEPSLILIDGRARVYIALKLFSLKDLNFVVLFDDFFYRKEYQIILNYYDLIERGDKIAVLTPKMYMREQAILESNKYVKEFM